MHCQLAVIDRRLSADRPDLVAEQDPRDLFVKSACWLQSGFGGRMGQFLIDLITEGRLDYRTGDDPPFMLLYL
jgi:hypothetical protein